MLRSIPAALLIAGGSLLLPTALASAHTYTARFSITPVTATPSLNAAMVMAAQGFSGFTAAPTWPTTYLADCQTRSSGVSITAVAWPSGCHLQGISQTINATAAQHWVVSKWSQFNGESAEQYIIYAMRTWWTPVVIPIDGKWTKWATVNEIVTTLNARSEELIRGVSFYDATPGGMGNVTSMNIMQFLRTYSDILQFDGAPCDATLSCDSGVWHDPWYLNWIVLAEPPVGGTLMAAAETPRMERSPAPGLDLAGAPLDARTASLRAFEAIKVAAMEQSTAGRIMLQSGHADNTAVKVKGVWARNQAHSYYLVPVRLANEQVGGFVQLDATTGALDSVSALAAPISYDPVQPQQAMAVAERAVAAEERLLGAPELTWDASESDSSAHSPEFPYYQFSVVDQSGHARGVVRVSYREGKLVGRTH